MPLTPQQETAVYNRGGSLLVSAAAGSGKTKVLVERLFSYMEQEGCQVDDFLIITYTKAAAAELRGTGWNQPLFLVPADPVAEVFQSGCYRTCRTGCIFLHQS